MFKLLSYKKSREFHRHLINQSDTKLTASKCQHLRGRKERKLRVMWIGKKGEVHSCRVCIRLRPEITKKTFRGERKRGLNGKLEGRRKFCLLAFSFFWTFHQLFFLGAEKRFFPFFFSPRKFVFLPFVYSLTRKHLYWVLITLIYYLTFYPSKNLAWRREIDSCEKRRKEEFGLF